jgi:hypothetical protein
LAEEELLERAERLVEKWGPVGPGEEEDAR